MKKHAATAAPQTASVPLPKPAPTRPPAVVLLGNTTVKIYPTDGRRLRANLRREIPTADFLARPLTRLPRALRDLLTRPLLVCSVHREALAHLRAFAHEFAGPLHIYGDHFGPGLPIRLPTAHHATIGRDRLAACRAALHEFPAGALVCDVGTALTINRVTPRGFEGGLIAPGLLLSLAALHQGTSQLPRVAFQPAKFPAQNTPDALRLGALMAVTGAIEKVHADQTARAGLPPPPMPTRRSARAAKIQAKNRPASGLPLILTGGSAIMIQRFLTPRGICRPHLVATGVWQSFCAGDPPPPRRK